MSKDPRTVSIRPQDVGELLSEVFRAYLMAGTPSAALSRLIFGAAHARTQGVMSAEDAAFTEEFEQALHRMREQWRAKEIATYVKPETGEPSSS